MFNEPEVSKKCLTRTDGGHDGGGGPKGAHSATSATGGVHPGVAAYGHDQRGQDDDHAQYLDGSQPLVEH